MIRYVNFKIFLTCANLHMLSKFVLKPVNFILNIKKIINICGFLIKSCYFVLNGYF